jgi:hypothetical protein
VPDPRSNFWYPRLSRRGAGALALAGASALLLRPGRARAAVPAPLTFDVFRKGEQIGQHRVGFNPQDAGFVATTTIELEVKVAFVVVYRYRQNAVDTWQDGQLVRSEVTTNDDGKETAVRVAREGERLVGTGAHGRIDLPLGTMHDLCWWNIAITRTQRVLDAQNGGVNALAVQGPTEAPVEVGGRRIQARRFAVEAGKQSGTIWYDGDDRWVGATMLTKSEELQYRLAA